MDVITKRRKELEEKVSVREISPRDPTFQPVRMLVLHVMMVWCKSDPTALLSSNFQNPINAQRIKDYAHQTMMMLCR